MYLNAEISPIFTKINFLKVRTSLKIIHLYKYCVLHVFFFQYNMKSTGMESSSSHVKIQYLRSFCVSLSVGLHVKISDAKRRGKRVNLNEVNGGS